MINRKIALSAISILSAFTLVGGATFAFFTDVASSQDNTFSTGTPDLVISQDTGANAPASYVNDIPSPAINETGIAPNFSKTYKFWLKNNSTGTFSFNLNTAFADVVTTGTADIANQLTAQFTCKSDTDSNGSLDTTIATTGTFPINGWVGGGAAMGTLGPNDGFGNGLGTDETQCIMTINLGDVGNSYAGSSVRFDGVFTGTQS